jgi:hypothetical protein
VENFIYNPSIITFNQYEVPIENAAPKQPNPDLKTSNQQKAIWKQSVTEELITSGYIRFCIRKYLTSAWSVAKANRAGIMHITNFPASCEIKGSWPSKLNSFPM